MENIIARQTEKLKKKLSSDGGFSFTELLAVTIIMMLATGLLTQTLDLAIDQFYKRSRDSEAQLLCSALTEFVEDELSFAEVMVKTDDSGNETLVKTDGSTAGNVVYWSRGSHHMGNDIYFLVDKTEFGTGTVGSSTSEVTKDLPNESGIGQIVMTSDAYQAYAGANVCYNIAGQGGYAVNTADGARESKKNRYNLKAAMSLNWADGLFRADIVVYGSSDGNSWDLPLAEEKFIVKPMYKVIKESGS